MTRHLMTLLMVALLATTFAAGDAAAKSGVNGSPHDLSATGGTGQNKVSFASEGRVCVFCHVPHQAQAGLPLWSRELSQATYTPYQSSTLKANPKPDRPTGASRLCLSCHDGTIALTQYVSSNITGGLPMQGSANLTTDLSNDHPISFSYGSSVGSSTELVAPGALPSQIKLEGGDILQCTSCHDPHDNELGRFLVINNNDPTKPGYQTGAPLCVACHKPTGWDPATHNPAVTNSLAGACMNCHMSHNAPGAVRLLKQVNDPETCYSTCHNSSSVNTQSNIKDLIASTPYRHPVDIPVPSGQSHDEAESLPAQNYHVACADCHNPHQANKSNAPLKNPPLIDGRLAGVRGVTQTLSVVTPAVNEYEVCFRCHAGGSASLFSGRTVTSPTRMITDPQQEERFNINNPSYHPVTSDRKGGGASLLASLKTSMIRIYCSDCHNNDKGATAGGTGPNGPHGSTYPHILAARYDMPPNVASGAPAVIYALCFRCHDYNYVMVSSDSGFYDKGDVTVTPIRPPKNEHAVHVNFGLPCYVCHDPHGVPQAKGATGANNAHLINFDRFWTASAVVPVYTSAGVGAGSCTVSCHSMGKPDPYTHTYTH